jgi:hypothetical protein
MFKPNFLSVEQCRFIANQFLLTGANDQPGASGADFGLDVVRKVHSFELEGEAKAMYQAGLESVAGELAEVFGVSLVGSAGAHGLGYTIGCKYDLHADNCDPEYDSGGNLIGFRHSMPSRHLSTLLFLGDSVEELTGDFQHVGGNLSFPFLVDEDNESLLIEPRCGLFVAFPSDPVYSHQVHEVYDVSTYYRFAIVDWHVCKSSAERERYSVT